MVVLTEQGGEPSQRLIRQRSLPVAMQSDLKRLHAVVAAYIDHRASIRVGARRSKVYLLYWLIQSRLGLEFCPSANEIGCFLYKINFFQSKLNAIFKLKKAGRCLPRYAVAQSSSESSSEGSRSVSTSVVQLEGPSAGQSSDSVHQLLESFSSFKRHHMRWLSDSSVASLTYN